MKNLYVVTAQTALTSVGFYKDNIDGEFGERTLAAINEALKLKSIDVQDVPAGSITANFKLSELTHSNTAVARKISNKPSATHKQNLIAAATHLFQPARNIIGEAMHINSGYRSADVNKAVGGSATSAHSVGFAIDFVAPKYGSTVKIAKLLEKELVAKGIKFDQIILEFPNTSSTWVHLGYKNSAGHQRGQVLTAKKINGRTNYLTGIHE